MRWEIFLYFSAALLAACFFLTSWVRITLHKMERDARIDGNALAVKEAREAKNYTKMAASQILITGLVLTGGFCALYMLQNAALPGVISQILSTGIHMPILLMLYGWIIKKAVRAASKRGSGFVFPIEEEIETLLTVTVGINFCLILSSWQIGLFIAALILGKYIWIDFVFDFSSLREDVRKLFQKMRDARKGKITVTYISMIFATNYK